MLEILKENKNYKMFLKIKKFNNKIYLNKLKF